MKKTILALVFVASSLSVGCGAPVEDGSAEDVKSQQEALLATPGHCLVIKATVSSPYTETGACVAQNTPYTCAVANSTDCLAGRVATSVTTVASCMKQVSSTVCQ